MFKQRKAIALLITMLFIIAITVSIGVGLKYVNEASNEVKNESILIQASASYEDVLTLLKNSKELDSITKNSSISDFYIFLSKHNFLTFERAGISVDVELNSARSRFNPNTINIKNAQALREYMRKNMVNDRYVDILLDSTGGIKKDLSYNTDIFMKKPFLFRDYIVSKEHLDELNSFYTNSYHDNSLKNVDFEKLFYFSSDKNSFVDLNFATAEVWELILETSADRAKELSLNGGNYDKLESISLSEEEKVSIAKFNVSYFEPYIDVKVKLHQNNKNVQIRFEYNIKNKEGSNISYEF